ncbi:MAG: MbnH family di-heme enzyme [Sphingomonas sp.]|jgi:cytochrome c peroxidase|uniref:MbnH family di-heme enzyme n=1 Tax=Sphingomonas sp. TaxID=28214 RepID=UPI003564B2A2
MRRLCFAIMLASSAVIATAATRDAGYRLPLPDWVPQPPRTTMAGMSPARIALGRALFYDTRLSTDGSMSCAACHQQTRAFTDGEPTHRGVLGDPGVRNVPSLANLAWLPTLNWANPNLKRLEAQVLIPIFGDRPVEMGMQGRERELFAALDRDAEMMALLRSAYPAKRGFDLEALTGSLAAFLKSITSFDSPYDRYKRLGDTTAISDAAKRGEALFFGERLECSHCHGGVNFTDNFQSAGNPFAETGFHNTGLYNEDGKGAYPKTNAGARDVTGRPEDDGRFRSPSLRNVALTAPYMHDGSIATLYDVIRRHYAIAGRSSAGPNGANPNRDPLITGFSISDPEIADLIAFLDSLTDQNFVSNPVYGPPQRHLPAGAK